MTIWKFPLHMGDTVEVAMPEGARVLCVQMQGNTPCLWALVDPKAVGQLRYFGISGTGHMRDDLTAAPYIGTFQMEGGALVFHVFEVGKPSS